MAFVSWPAGVNAYAVRDTYSEKPERSVAAFAPELGAAVERQRTSMRQSLVAFEGRYTETEWAALLDFYFDTIKNGVLPFALKNPYNGRLGIYKFTEVPAQRTVRQLKVRASISLRRLTEVERETQSYLNAMTVAPPTEIALAYNNFIRGLKVCGLWAKATDLRILCAHDAQAARLLVNAPGTDTLAEVGGPLFYPYAGYGGDGVGAHLTATRNYSSFAQQDNAAAFIYTLTDAAGTYYDLGTAAAGNLLINPRNGSNQLVMRANSTTNGTIAGVTSSVGLFGWSRNGAATYAIYQGATGSAQTDASAAPSASPLTILRYGAVYSPRVDSFSGLFTYLSAAEVALLKRCVDILLAQMLPNADLALLGISWLPRLNGNVPSFYADFTTEGGSNHYWAGGAQRAGSAAWLSALTGSFARNSLGAYNTVGGLVAFAAANALRFDFDLTSHAANGIPYEPAATNVLLQSKDFTQAAWVKVFANGASAPVVTANAGTSPDGTATAQRLQAARTGAAGSYSLLTQTANVAAGNPVSDGFWLKSNTGTNQNVLCYDPANAYGTVFVATPIWQRVALPPHTAGAQVAVAIGTTAGSGGYFQGGDATIDVLIWNAQITLEAAPSSDIVTGAASATRLADALSITIPGGVSQIVVIFDDNSTQTVAGLSAGAYTVPTNLNRARIKSMAGYP